MKKPVVIGIVFLAVVLGVMMYTTFGSSPYKVTVCMEFKGSTNCKTASGEQEDLAMRAAVNNACGDIAGGVTDTIACESSYPKSITWVKRPPRPDAPHRD